MEDETKGRGHPPLYNTPEQMQAAIDLYFSTETKPTLTGLAITLGFATRQSLYDYEEREEYSYIIKRARIRVENGYEKQLYESSCTGAIFALKNMGWKDKVETEHSGNMGITWHEEKTYEA